MSIRDGGYLVVESPRRTDSKYRGIGLVPPYHHSYTGEYGEAMHDYVFKESIIDPQTGLIPSRDVAIDLAARLAASSRRSFEVIAVTPDRDATDAIGEECTGLGFDVAVLSGYWSIVQDFAVGDWATAHRSRLNEFDLFENRTDAERYLNDYRRSDADSPDAPFEVVYVRTCLEQSSPKPSN